jgi:hypothetical protein
MGDLIQAERDYPHVGMKRGVLYEVVDSGPGNRLKARDAEGNEVTFSPKLLHRALSIYTPETSELARGDRVRVTRNDAALDIANGDRFEVMRATPASVTLTDGRRVVELPADRPLHLDHAYATTVHSSQGTTADRVLIDAATHSRTTTKDVYCVAISRARLEARIYTDDVQKLPQAVAREAQKHAALDLARAATREHVHQVGNWGSACRGQGTTGARGHASPEPPNPHVGDTDWIPTSSPVSSTVDGALSGEEPPIRNSSR